MSTPVAQAPKQETRMHHPSPYLKAKAFRREGDNSNNPCNLALACLGLNLSVKLQRTRPVQHGLLQGFAFQIRVRVASLLRPAPSKKAVHTDKLHVQTFCQLHR